MHIGARVPSDRIIYGVDISDLFLMSRAKSPHQELFYGFEGVRQGEWKLVIPTWVDKKTTVVTRNMVELYQLESDLGEKTNLAAQYPEKV